MKKALHKSSWLGKLILGAFIFALGFDLFLEPNGLNAGGLTGLAMVVVHLLGVGSVGTATTLMNVPLFILGAKKLGKKFFLGSLVGLLSLSVSIDLLTALPVPQVEPLLACLYGGVVCGIGLGLIFMSGSSTGGSDIVVRLLKRKFQHMPIGTINICFDLVVAALTGIVFGDISRTLYSGVAIFLSGKIVDAVVYRFDYSQVALIISPQYAEITRMIAEKLDRGATYLNGQGSFTGKDTKVVLTAVKRQQLAELKALVVEIDPNAFIILQEAHQVLGDGFARYSKDAL